MAMQSHASMADLRGAIRHYRVIRFTYEGRNFEVEPHELTRHPVTGALELRAWVRGGPGGAGRGWKSFQYWKIRALDLMPDTFLPRLAARPGPVAV